jgi:hypothetical protein
MGIRNQDCSAKGGSRKADNLRGGKSRSSIVFHVYPSPTLSVRVEVRDRLDTISRRHISASA